MRNLTVLLFSLSLWVSAQSPEETRILRYPDIHDDKVAFVYAGDIWIADSNGGPAHHLTTHEGKELFPKFSPDGKWIAFSGEYNGNRQIYVISSSGGTPKQLTYYNDVGPMPPRGGFDYRVLDWTPDGKHVFFRANRLPWGVRLGTYYTVPVDGGLEQPLEIPEAGGGMLSPDGTKVVYTPIDREFRTWKRYRGGRAQDVWIYDLANHTSEQITDHQGTDNQPVWVGDKIYFASDRDKTLNLFSYDLNSKAVEKVSNHNDFDVLWVSAGPHQVVYECGGFLYKYDTRSSQLKKISIKVYSDHRYTMNQTLNVQGNIEEGDIAPNGKRALFTARGDLFTAPVKKGEIRNITKTPGVREKNAVWSPDGKSVAYFSDATGEYELYVRNQDGSGEATQLTKDGAVWRFNPRWSPDSKKIAYGDRNMRMWIVDVAAKTETEADRGVYGEITDYRWAPDSNTLVYTKVTPAQFQALWLYSDKDKKTTRLTGDSFSYASPVFSPDGKYLFFTSQRDMSLNFSDWEFQYLYDDSQRVYGAALTNETPYPFAPESDEAVEPAEEAKPEKPKTEKPKQKGKEKEEAEPKDEFRIDVEGFENRVFVLPEDNGGYRSLSAGKGTLFYLRRGDRGSDLRVFDLKSREAQTVLERVSGYTLSHDGNSILYSSRGQFGIVPAKPGQKPDNLNLRDMNMKVDPPKEWAQIYQDGWRLIRDWFYDPKMHGLDWKAVGEKYGQMVPEVTHRADLDFIFGELGGELNAGHFYVNSGDEPRVSRRENGLLGAEMKPHESGWYQVAKIFPGENWHDDFRCPLQEPGVNVKVGDFILAIDGEPVKTDENFYKGLEGKANQVVSLLVNDKPTMEGAHVEKVRPTNRETNLRYLDWVNSRREYVDKISNGRIGYIHMPNTAVEGNRELFRFFYMQSHKDALIFDARYNGGGFIPGEMIELLARKTLNYWAERDRVHSRTPGYVHEGPKICLMNYMSSSGGDAFPSYFRQMGFGKLVGTRTWGGLIGLRGNPGFLDGGSLSIPVFRYVDPDGNWGIENEGVTPDIEVPYQPERLAKGEDPTLETAIQELLKELEQNPPKQMKMPAPPDESN